MLEEVENMKLGFFLLSVSSLFGALVLTYELTQPSIATNGETQCGKYLVKTSNGYRMTRGDGKPIILEKDLLVEIKPNQEKPQLVWDGKQYRYRVISSEISDKCIVAIPKYQPKN